MPFSTGRQAATLVRFGKCRSEARNKLKSQFVNAGTRPPPVRSTTVTTGSEGRNTFTLRVACHFLPALHRGSSAIPLCSSNCSADELRRDSTSALATPEHAFQQSASRQTRVSPGLVQRIQAFHINSQFSVSMLGTEKPAVEALKLRWRGSWH